MGIPVQCEQCQAKFDAPERSAGKRGKCPGCGAPIQVPERQAAPEDELSLAPLPEGESSSKRKVRRGPESNLPSNESSAGKQTSTRDAAAAPPDRSTETPAGNVLAGLLEEELTAGQPLPNEKTAPGRRDKQPAQDARTSHASWTSEPVGPAPVLKRRRREPDPDSPAVTWTVTIFMVLAALLLVARMMAGYFAVTAMGAPGWVLAILFFAAIGECVAIYGFAVITGLAFSEDVTQGLLTLLVPFYIIFYTISRWQHANQGCLIWIMGFGIRLGSVLVPAMFLGLWAGFATTSVRSRNVQEAIPPQRVAPPRAQQPGPHSPPQGRPARDRSAPAAEAEPLPPRQWNVLLDPTEPPPSTLSGRLMPLESRLADVQQVRFSSAEAGRAVVLNRWFGARPAGTPPDVPNVWIDHYDLRTSELLGRIPLPGPCELADVSRDGTRALVMAKGHAEIWSLDEGKLLTDWQAGRQGMQTDGQGMFLDERHFATIDDQGRLMAWDIDEHLDPISTVENVACAARSPGGAYLAVLDRRPERFAGRIVEPVSAEVLGELAAPRQSRIHAQQCLFPCGGECLAAVASTRLIVWDMSTGEVQAETVHPGLGSPAMFVPGDFLLAGGQLFDPRRNCVVWQYDLPGGSAGWQKVDGSPDGRVWLAGAATMQDQAHLGAIPVPDGPTQQQIVAMPARPGLQTSRTKITLDMFEGGTELAGSAASGPARPVGPRPPASPWTPGTDDGNNPLAEYCLDLISGQDSAVVEALRWFPEAKRPTIGFRFGVGVYLAEQPQQPDVTTTDQLTQLTGPIGPAVIHALEQHAEAGNFGLTGAHAGGVLRQVPLLGGGKQSELLDRCRARGVNMLALFTLDREVTPLTKRIDVTLRLRLVDVQSNKTLWASPSISSKQMLVAARTGGDPTADFVDQLIEVVDEHCKLEPMPDLEPTHAERRVRNLLEEFDGTKNDLLSALVELRYFEGKGLIGRAEAREAYDKALGQDVAEEFLTADGQERREVLETWLEAP